MRNRKNVIIVYGDPVAKMLSRLRKGFKKELYDARSQDKVRQKVLVANQFNNEDFYDGPCEMDITYWMPIKKTHIVPEGTYYWYKPNIDGLVQWTMDLLQDITFKSNACVVVITVRKLYSRRPRTVIVIKELDQSGNKKRKTTKKQEGDH